MHNYSINDVSKLVNVASKRVIIARINVASHKYRNTAAVVAQASYESARGSHRGVILVVFIAKNSLEFIREIALNSTTSKVYEPCSQQGPIDAIILYMHRRSLIDR